MTTRMSVTANEHGIIRLFAIDLPREAAHDFTPEHLGAALGNIALDPDHVDIISVDDLDDLGLDGYLIHGLGASKSEVVQLRPQVRALKGHVALIRSAAFAGPATLTPQRPLRWIASFGETGMDLTSKPMQSDAAKGILTPPATSPLPIERSPRALYLMIALVIFIAAIMSLLT